MSAIDQSQQERVSFDDKSLNFDRRDSEDSSSSVDYGAQIEIRAESTDSLLQPLGQNRRETQKYYKSLAQTNTQIDDLTGVPDGSKGLLYNSHKNGLADIADEDYESLSDLSEDLARDVDCWPSDDEGDISELETHSPSAAPASQSKNQLMKASFVSKRSRKQSAKSGKSIKSHLTSVKAREKLKETENPTLAIIFFVIFCFLRSVSYVVVDELYNRQPELSPWQMFFMRSCMGIAIMTLHMNRNVKKETWDSIECRKSGPLVFKTFTGVSTNLIQYSVTKFIPATIISIVANLAPIIVVILAFLILKETVRKFDVLMILLTLVGIFTIILGGDEAAESGKATPTFPSWILYIMLFFNPFLSAGGTVSMRKMAKFSDSVVSWYLQWGTLICSIALILPLGQGFAIFGNFDIWDWLLAFATGFTSVYSETMRFKALKLHKAAALQKLIPLTTLFQWVFDISIFGIHYSWIQDAGLAYLMLIYILQGLKYAFIDSKKKAKMLAEHDLKKSMLRTTSSAQQPPQIADESNDSEGRDYQDEQAATSNLVLYDKITRTQSQQPAIVRNTTQY